MNLCKLIVKNCYDDNKIRSNGKFLYAEGELPICFIAHLDTVLRRAPNKVLYDPKENIMWGIGGLGADDRAGVFLILMLITKTAYRPSILFTTDEESGGMSDYDFVKSISLKNLPFNFIIELDRQGYNDCVFYQCDNKKFIKYIESFGFKFQKGTFTDIYNICPLIKKCGVNLSVGYFYEHTMAEFLDLNILMEVFDKINNICYSNNFPEFEWKENKKYSSFTVVKKSDKKV